MFPVESRDQGPGIPRQDPPPFLQCAAPRHLSPVYFSSCWVAPPPPVASRRFEPQLYQILDFTWCFAAVRSFAPETHLAPPPGWRPPPGWHPPPPGWRPPWLAPPPVHFEHSTFWKLNPLCGPSKTHSTPIDFQSLIPRAVPSLIRTLEEPYISKHKANITLVSVCFRAISPS